MMHYSDKDMEKLCHHDLTRWHNCHCNRCGLTLGKHSAVKLFCFDSKMVATSTVFRPSCTTDFMYWYLTDAITKVLCPFIELKIELESSVVKSEQIVKPKVYRHECPCGLIVCDYHQVIK